ncbi:DUF4767 domain-containing protein [Streptococcus sp.]
MKRKEKVGAVVLLLAGLVTVGCSKRTPRHSSQLNNSSETKAISSSSKKEVKKDYKKLYQPVFEDYQKILTSPKDTANIASLYQSLHATERPINSWAIENAVNQADEMRYAFADLNNDGIEELLIADLNLSGKYFLTGLYYLQAGKPVLLAEGFVASHGGARNATLVYKGGEVLELSWSSGTGQGYGTLYQLNAKQEQATILQEKEIQIQANDIAADFGKNASDQIDLRGLNWQEFEVAGSSTSAPTATKAPWNPNKSAKLEAFIKDWGEKLGQPNYQKGIAGGDVGADHLYILGDGPSEKMNAEYTDTGLGNAQYRIVERYSNWDKYPDVHSYFFAITNTGEPIVFHSDTTNGGQMYLKPTENAELQAEFKRLVEEE